MKGYGKRIQFYRKKKNYSQEKLGQKVGGKSKSYISKIEAETTPLSLELLFKIAEVLDVSPGDLLEDKAILPEALRDVGVKWIYLGRQLEEEGITPEQVQKWAEIAIKYSQDKDQ